MEIKFSRFGKITGQNKWDLLRNSKYPNPDNFSLIDGNIEEIENIITDKSTAHNGFSDLR